mgnify:CR=1 FL=1
MNARIPPTALDTTQALTDVKSFAVLEPKADGFRHYFSSDSQLPPAEALVEKANYLTLSVPEMAVLVGGLRTLDANTAGVKHGVFTSKPGTLSNDFFVNLLDMGTAWSPASPANEVYEGRDRKTGAVTAVNILLGDSNLQLQAYAAPLSGGLWEDIRSGLVEGLERSGSHGAVVDGPLGPEIHARMPRTGQLGADQARAKTAPVRFIGIDGPRWFLRAVISGPAAVDREKAGLMYALLKATVVHRDEVPREPRSLLPLHLLLRPIVALSVAASFAIAVAMFGAIIYIPVFAQGVIGVNATNSGLILMPLMLGFIICGILERQVVNRGLRRCAGVPSVHRCQ